MTIMSLEDAKAHLAKAITPGGTVFRVGQGIDRDARIGGDDAEAIRVVLAALRQPQPAPEPDEAPLGQDAPIGTLVFVKLDSGADWVTETRSEPWQLGGGQWVVALKGKAGGYALDRVRRVPR